jgi:hypothetical protein
MMIFLKMSMEPPLKAYTRIQCRARDLAREWWKSGNTPDIKFDDTTGKKTANGEEVPNGRHPHSSQWESTTSISFV